MIDVKTTNLQGIVTTSGRPSIQGKNKAKRLAEAWKLPFEERNKRSVKMMIKQFDTTIFVVYSTRIEAHDKDGHPPFFFHPNAAMFRAKRWYHNGDDPLVSTCKIMRGDIVIDATLGLGSDAQLASLAAGESGKVIGLESSPVIAQIVQEGLVTYQSSFQPLNEAMRRIEVFNINHLTWFQAQTDNSVDIVYFDPMFETEVNHSDGFEAIRYVSSDQSLTSQVIEEAKRIARKRVVLKDHFRSNRFEWLGFDVQIRRSSTYHFGIIELEKSEKK